ncbi:MAG: hypothetical protein ACYDH9_23075 [Limisphaerales bacterium]
MTTTKLCSSKLIVALLGTAALTLSAVAQTPTIVYNNSTTATGSTPFFAPGTEYGDQINLAGTSRFVTEFKFQYYLAAGSGTAELRAYDMTGSGASLGIPSTPGNLLYDSTAFPISAGANGYNIVDINGANFNAPANGSFTWTVSFTGTGTNHVGLLLYNPPTVGTSLNDFWVRNSDGTWSIQNFGSTGPVANFGAQVIAVPEPTVLQFGMVSGLVGFGMLLFRRRAVR